MKKLNNLCILLTCHNRIAKTETCLRTLIEYINLSYICKYQIYLVDDGCSDNTCSMVTKKYPFINIIHGSGSLFWAGGMRLAWETAINSQNNYDGFLLINDDVEFIDSFWEKISFTNQWCKNKYSQTGIYVLSVKDKETGKLSYGGYNLKKMLFKHQKTLIYPSENTPVLCQLANANILYVSEYVVKKIGILDSHFTHSLADYDYTLKANEKKIPVLICPGYGGYCSIDHPQNVLSSSLSLKKRIHNLYSVKGVALNEYIYYLKKHFWWKAPYAFIVLWLRTLLPNIIREK